MARKLAFLDARRRIVPQPEDRWRDLSRAWAGLPVGARRIQGRESFGPSFNPEPTLTWCIDGSGGWQARAGIRRYECPFATNNIAVYSRGFEIDGGDYEGSAIDIVAMQFTPDVLERLLGDEARHFNLPVIQQANDFRLIELLAASGREIEEGCPSGELYAEGLSLAILGRLRMAFPHGGEQRRHPGRLAPQRFALVVDYMNAYMGTDISIAALAGIAGLSASQFGRAFKATTGVTPYRYIQQLRMQRAVVLMKGSSSLADIALAVGMTSQSHFSSTFRKIVGVSPGQARTQGRWPVAHTGAVRHE